MVLEKNTAFHNSFYFDSRRFTSFSYYKITKILPAGWCEVLADGVKKFMLLGGCCGAAGVRAEGEESRIDFGAASPDGGGPTSK